MLQEAQVGQEEEEETIHRYTHSKHIQWRRD